MSDTAKTVSLCSATVVESVTSFSAISERVSGRHSLKRPSIVALKLLSVHCALVVVV